MENNTNKTLDERISYYDYHEPITYAIARTLRDKGYQIADSLGERVSEPKHNVLGILEPQKPIKRSFLGLKWNKKQRALYTGDLWVDNDSKKAKPDENWVLEVYGRDNVPKLIELVKELSEPKQVHVQVRLESEQPKEETYDSNYDF